MCIAFKKIFIISSHLTVNFYDYAFNGFSSDIRIIRLLYDVDYTCNLDNDLFFKFCSNDTRTTGVGLCIELIVQDIFEYIICSICYFALPLLLPEAYPYA